MNQFLHQYENLMGQKLSERTPLLVQLPLVIVDILVVYSLVIVKKLSKPIVYLSCSSLVVVDTLVIVDNLLLRNKSTIARGDCI